VKRLVEVSPFRCRVWHLHPRSDATISEETCEEEIRSFKDHRQIVPAIGRKLPPGQDHDIEIICGARRLFVARHLNVPLLVELRALSEREAAIAVETENAERVDVSPYERGLGLARWLREGHFSSQSELASALQMPPSRLCRLMRLASLPKEVIAAFGDGANICERWGVVLATALENDTKREAILKTCRTIAAVNLRPQPPDVYKLLNLVAANSGKAADDCKTVVTSATGTPLFEIKRQSGSILVVLPLSRISAKSLKAIEHVVAQIMRPHAEAQAAADVDSGPSALS
jgi:ParB family transcriptional regulator, chromosome partitioning protein